MPLPAQDADLPKHLEAGIERGGQVLKRRLFQQAVEQADAELILARRHGKDGRGIICRGTTPYTFKTVFGTVRVRRRRIEHKADGTTEVPSAHAWQTPRQVAITPACGTRPATACSAIRRNRSSPGSTPAPARPGCWPRRPSWRSSTRRGSSSRRRPTPAPRRSTPATPRPSGSSSPRPARTKRPPSPEIPTTARTAAEEAATPALIGFPGGPTDPPEVKRDHPRQVDPDVVLVELDEVKVHAQAHTGRKEVLALTALVMIAGRCWHLAAATTRELVYQVGALLAVLGVHRGTRRLLVLADGRGGSASGSRAWASTAGR